MPYNELDIRMKFQCRAHYCYASVIQAVVRHYTGQNISQRAIEEAYGTEQNFAYQDPVDYLAPLGLIHAKSAAHYGHKGIPPWKTVETEIQHNRPIIVFAGVHYVLLVGYEGESARDPQRFYIFLDPLYPVPQAVSYLELKENGYIVGDNYENVRGYYLTRPL